MTHLRARRRLTVCATVLTTSLALGFPADVAGHQLTGRYESPLPLGVYLLGAAVAVGLSFAFVLLRPVSSERILRASEAADRARRTDTPAMAVPVWLRALLRAVGLVGWGWVVVQALATSDAAGADVASLFLWVYGWVGLAVVSAFVGPAWRWLDPFVTLHDLAAAGLRRLGVRGWTMIPYPTALARWPAVAGFFVFVWLELAVPATRSGRPLAAALLAYTAWTLLMMAQFGRDVWRSHGEVFSVWFGTLGRLAPFAAAGDKETGGDRVRRQRLPNGLLAGPWDRSRVVLVAIATGAILFDGLSQTQAWFDRFGAPDVARETVLLVAFLGLVCLAALVVARLTGVAALGAGLLPIAVGYLIAHYLTYLVGDGQRIVVALSDPLGLGWNLIGLTELEPSVDWLPPGLVWAAQIVAVVGGHIVGAWAGHDAAIAEAIAEEPSTRLVGVGGEGGRGGEGAVGSELPERVVRRARLEQVPLAVLMVCLTTLTLWSLGQGIVKSPSEGAAPGTMAAAASWPPVDEPTWAPT